MGQAKKNRRDCPVVGHEISSADCGNNRGSRYDCPASCPHNPWSAANYDRALEIEDSVTPKMMRRLTATPPFNLDPKKDIWRLSHFYMSQFHLHRDSTGRNFFDRWQAEGWQGLNNDEQVFIQCKARSRVGVLEVHRVLRDECEVVDLLDPGATPLLFHDRGMAASAVRFAQFLTWEFPMPHYHRVNGNGILLPEVAGLDGLDVLREIVRHLGGPVEPEPMRAWLAVNFVRVMESVLATNEAQRNQVLQSVDAQFTSTTYQLRSPAPQLLSRLDKLPALSRDDLSDKEIAEGIRYTRVWFDEPVPRAKDQSMLEFPHHLSGHLGRPVLGRILVADGTVRIEAGSAARHQSLRAQFEKLAGHLVQFRGERVEDVAAQLRHRHPVQYDASLVPPSLLQQPQKFSLIASRIDTSDYPPGLTPDQLAAHSLQKYIKTYPDIPLPLLNNRTPRQAAADPAMRPQLLVMLKHFVRNQDYRNLQIGRTDDINGLLRELGATELIFDPPPLRPATKPLKDNFDDESEDEMAPPIPGMLDPDEVRRQLEEIAKDYLDVTELIKAFADEAPEVADLVREFTGPSKGELDQTVMLFAAAQAWFVMFPPGTKTGKPNFQRVIENFKKIGNLIFSANIKALHKILETGHQPHLVTAIAAGTIEMTEKGPLRHRVSPECLALLPIFLHVLANELDELIHEMNRKT